MSDRIRVPGYAKRVFFNDNIEYRPFSTDLVGLQFTNPENSPQFSVGSFVVTTNLSKKKDKDYATTSFSNFETLTSLDSTLYETITISNNSFKYSLNLDNTKFKNYALFGSLTEFVRVSLEKIILE
jgi:hypothetical protein